MAVSSNTQKSIAFVEVEDALEQLARCMGAATDIVTNSLLDTQIYAQTLMVYDQTLAIALNAKNGKLELERTIKICEEIFHLNKATIKQKSMNPLIPETLIAILNSAANYAKKAPSLIRAALDR